MIIGMTECQKTEMLLSGQQLTIHSQYFLYFEIFANHYVDPHLAKVSPTYDRVFQDGKTPKSQKGPTPS